MPTSRSSLERALQAVAMRESEVRAWAFIDPVGARAAAEALDGAPPRATGRRRPWGQRPFRHRRATHRVRVAHLRRQGRDHRCGRGQRAETGRRGPAGQDRHLRARRVPPGTDQEPTRPGPDAGGLVDGVGRRGGRGYGRYRPGLADCGFGREAGELLRRLWVQADVRGGADRRAEGDGTLARHGGLVRSGRGDRWPRDGLPGGRRA